MDDYCDLRAANGEEPGFCEGEVCSFWRVVEHVAGEAGSGCAVKHYQLLGNDDIAVWLLSVKERVDGAGRSTSRRAECE
jgi:hypothetical protein